MLLIYADDVMVVKGLTCYQCLLTLTVFMC